MEAKVISKHNKISAQKARLVANEIKGLVYPEAVEYLKVMPQKAAELILKALNSAGANAKYLKPDTQESELYIKKIYVNDGPSRRGLRMRSHGRANRLYKRTSHISIILSDEK